MTAYLAFPCVASCPISQRGGSTQRSLALAVPTRLTSRSIVRLTQESVTMHCVRASQQRL